LPERWQFWIDRGGTFTDIVARRPDGRLVTHKLLSENPQRYDDAALAGIRALLGTPPGRPLPMGQIAAIKMGTTVATNALLERAGARTLFVTTKGFADCLVIGDQSRPDLFALRVERPAPLYAGVVEADQRMDATGVETRALDASALTEALGKARAQGFASIAIALPRRCMCGWKFSTRPAWRITWKF